MALGVLINILPSSFGQLVIKKGDPMPSVFSRHISLGRSYCTSSSGSNHLRSCSANVKVKEMPLRLAIFRPQPAMNLTWSIMTDITKASLALFLTLLTEDEAYSIALSLHYRKRQFAIRPVPPILC
ncbi:hypothetical protein PABG_11181 [Paracoccidioides brasiliensis Pb03]|nr:hypothetical protein PABG_11181 [Paracoccidioides brasiliensis Pb03]